MNFCKKCLLPDTRPSIYIDRDGVCSACRNFEIRSSIDWIARERSFEDVISNAKLKSKGYDCLIPVSGGKDSTWQVVKCLEKGLNPLCVTWKPPGRTEIGQENLDNLISLGVDHIDYSINPEVEKKFMLEALIKKGSPAIPMHIALFNIPLNIALKFQIPLVIWGENSAFEYGDPTEEKMGFRLNKNWYKNFGVTHGTTAKDWVSDKLSEQELTPYCGPDLDELEKNGVLAIFLGYYYEWDVLTTRDVALSNGFKSDNDGARTGIYNFADIDDVYISIHHYIKWYKFGFTRSFDNLSLEIRNKRLSRNEAIEILKKQGENYPKNDIEKFCKFVGIEESDFLQIIEKFRNLDIWYKDKGVWKIRDFIIDEWAWE